MLKVLKWFALIFIIAIVGMIGAYYLAKKYEAPVTEYIVKRINERLNAPVHSFRYQLFVPRTISISLPGDG